MKTVAINASESVAIRPREAAALLGIHRRTLASLSAPHGTIPCARLSKRLVLYSVSDLQQWLSDRIHAESRREKVGA